MNNLLLMVDFSMMVLIWLVQLIIYPSFLRVDKSVFLEWHSSYTLRISFFVVPLMFMQLGLSAYLCFKRENLLSYSHLFFVILSWVSTFLLSVPIHSKLSDLGYDDELIKKLIKTNLPRSITWSFVCLIDLASMKS